MQTKLFTTLIVLLASVTALATPPEPKAKSTFTTRCASCHAINKTLTGPALAGISERRSIEWIVNFVKSSQTMVQAGDKEAVAIFEKFNKIPMPAHPDLSTEDIKGIVNYIKSEASAVEKAPFGKPLKLRPAYTPLTYANAGFFVSYFIVVALLVLTLLFAVEIKQYERNKFWQ